MHIAVTGASGLIGRSVVPLLRADGHRVSRLVRGPVSARDEISWDPLSGHLSTQAVQDVDTVIHLAGAGIGDRRWTPRRKALIRDSRVLGTRAVATALAGAAERDDRARTLLSASAIGWYGDTGDRLLDERAPAGTGFLADTCRAWEAAAAPAADAGVRVATLRTGLVLAPHGGLLGRLLPIFRLGLGGPISAGTMWWSWISLRDEVDAIRFLVREPVSGPVNLVAPRPVTNAAFTKELARQLHRPAVFRVPGFALRAVVGEFADEGILVGQRLAPRTLTRAGFAWSHPDLESALRWALA